MFSFYSKRNLVNFSSIILCCLPLTLQTGPFLSDLSVVLIGLIFLTISIKEKLWNYYNNKFFIFFIIFYFYFVFSSLISTNIVFSLESSLLYFRFGIFSLATWYLLENDNNLIKKFTISFLIIFIIVIIDGYYQYFVGNSIFGFVSNSVNRLTLTFNDKMILGGYLSRLFPFLFALIIYNFSKEKKYVVLIFILLILIDCLTFLTGERTALSLLLLSTVMILLITSKFKLLRIITIVISITVISFLASTNNSIKQRNIDYTISQLSGYSNKLTYFSFNHESLALAAINIYKDNKIFGAGPKQFRVLCDNYVDEASNLFCSTHPHNSYLQLLSETGTIGVLFIIIPFVYLVYLFTQHLINKINKREVKLSDYQLCLLICIFLSLWPFIPTQSFFNNWINIIYYLPVGFLLNSIYTKKITNFL